MAVSLRFPSVATAMVFESAALRIGLAASSPPSLASHDTLLSDETMSRGTGARQVVPRASRIVSISCRRRRPLLSISSGVNVSASGHNPSMTISPSGVRLTG